MPNPIFFSLVLHNHQPVGNFDFVNDHAYRMAYLPLVELLEKHPGVQVGLHFSGSLLDWLIQRDPELLERVKALVVRGQVEVLTGGYYEPVLAVLRDADKLGQIRKLTDTVRQWFGAEPKGVWLAERIWEPHLAKPLVEAGVRYVIVDDTHFEGVGFDKDKDLFGYFVTEEQGYALAVFPTLTRLRYSIPWYTVDDNIRWFQEQARESLPSLLPKLAFMGEDGEKFGVWPGTHEHCWTNGYMENLFAALEANNDWLRTITPSAFMEKYPALGRVYLPTASYMEMGEWSLPSHRSNELTDLRHSLQNEGNRRLLRFLRGGIWRNFMIKYAEINHMHKRALQISRAVHAMPDGPAKDQALNLLWAAQSNDAYWHGVFGGVYLFHFRIANYANLIAAEMLAEGPDAPLAVSKFDLDMDSNDELLLTGMPFSMIWDLARGGALRELDFRPARYNLLNVMTRRDEGYHQDLVTAASEGRAVIVGSEEEKRLSSAQAHIVRVKEPGMERYLIADWYRRGAFIDHFLRQDATLDGFYRAGYPEQGDYVILPYQAEWTTDGRRADIRLTRDGRVWVGERHLPVRVAKYFHLEQGASQVRVTYALLNQSDQAIDVRFGVETALAFDGGDNPDLCAFELGGARLSLMEVAGHEEVGEYGAFTRLRNLRAQMTLSRSANLWRFPLETVTISEAGFERGYQGTVFLQWWPLHLEPGQEWDVVLTLEVSTLE